MAADLFVLMDFFQDPPIARLSLQAYFTSRIGEREYGHRKVP